MKQVTNHTDLDSGVGIVGQSDGTLETLIFFWVVVSESNLELASLLKLTLLSVGKHLVDVLLHLISWDFAKGI